ncbi:MAG: pyridoxamine kinase [Firmicutes bacterium]|nr:pyridoxamine kinase [Bacillota bacterium]
MKNVLAIHDISCVGRCSLTVCLPIISAMGSTCASLPTALLSTHTGGFDGFTCLDLTDEMRKIVAAWRPLSLKFDALYSGFLACAAQTDTVKNLIAEYKTPHTTVIIDPVMGDDGKLYKVFDKAFVEKMKQLLPLADILVPNITEAMLLTDTPYSDGSHTPALIESILIKLQKAGAKQVVLTGVFFKEGELGVAVSGAQSPYYYFTPRIAGSFHGTGDIFGSVLTASLMRGVRLEAAAAAAADFVVQAIHATPPNADTRYGVNFEAVLKTFAVCTSNIV